MSLLHNIIKCSEKKAQAVMCVNELGSYSSTVSAVSDLIKTSVLAKVLLIKGSGEKI